MRREILGFIVIFSLISMVGMIFGVLLWGVNQDYVLFEINEVSRNLENHSIISSDIADSIEASGNKHVELVEYFDWWWLGGYIMFFASTLVVAYWSREEGEFSFLVLLFYGTLAFLFVLSIMTVMTDWFSTDILYKLVPNLEGSFPKFDWVIGNFGIISMIQILLCLFINKMDFKITKNQSLKQDIVFEDEGEVL